MWIFPAVVALVAGDTSSAYEATPTSWTRASPRPRGVPPLHPATDWKAREFTLRWDDAARIDWGTIVLFGTCRIFGTLLESSGLAKTIGKGAFDGARHRQRRCHHGVRASSRHRGVRDDLQHSLRGRRRPDRHLARQCSRSRSTDACPGRDVRGVVRLHAAGVHAAERDRLRVRHGAHHRMIRSGFSFDIIGELLILLMLPILASVLL